jgi:transposase-like protein
MDKAEADVLAYINFPAQHRTKLHSINPLERLNGEIKRRSEVVGIFPNAWAAERTKAVVRLIGTLLLTQNDEWAKLAKVPSAKPMECQRREASEPAT